MKPADASWKEDMLEELRAIHRILDQGNGKEVEYFPDGKIKRISSGLIGFNVNAKGDTSEAS